MTPESNLPIGFEKEAALQIQTNPEDIARGIEELVSMSDDQREGMGIRGRTLVEDRFTWPQVAHSLRQVYDWILGGGVPPECVRTD